MDAEQPIRARMEALARRTQAAICTALTELDGSAFREDRWERTEGGGGISRILEGGPVVEKAGVNVAAIHGHLSPAAGAAASGGEAAEGLYQAVGISSVIHPANPMAPTAHVNYRYFERQGDDGATTWWFGGGADLTPAYLFEEDVRRFHAVHKAACDRHDPSFYPRFKAGADEYFHVAHRRERRGVGGIFFDLLADRDPEALLAFVADCAAAFVPAYLPILERRKDTPFTEGHRRWQQIRRGRYVEFNLVYDRGTSFGLRSGGRIESILMSLPPVGRWDYDGEPGPDSEEARLVEVLRHPRDWV